MLITWRYRKRQSLIQSFDPRAWMIFYGCFMVSSVLFWDLHLLAPLLVIALVVVFTSEIKWREMYRAWLFIGEFIVFFSLLTFLTGRGGMEFYTEEHLITSLSAVYYLQLTLDAQRARGYEFEKLRGGPIAQVRKLAPLIVPVTIMLSSAARIS